MTLTKNLRKVAKQATPEHWKQGKVWYSEAHEFCKALASVSIYTQAQVTGALAALSPQTSWSINKRATADLVVKGTCEGYTGYTANVDKAKRILAGESISTVLCANPRHGAKVRSFFDNILNPSTSELVTIDTHAIRAAYNIVEVPRQISNSVFSSSKYHEVSDAYRKIAKEYSMRPCELQAVLWLTVKDAL